jgi:hypothetical protein
MAILTFFLLISNVQAQDFVSKNKTPESILYEAKNFSFETILGPSGDIYLALNQHGRSQKDGNVGYFHETKSTCEILMDQIPFLQKIALYQQKFPTEASFSKKIQNPLEFSFLKSKGLSYEKTTNQDNKEKCFCNNKNDIPNPGLSHSVCAIRVDNYLSPGFKQLVNAYSHTSGPNCYNEALFATGMQKTLRHTTLEEINFLLNEIVPPVCELVHVKNSQPGDLVVIKSKDQNGNFSISHSYTYISNELVLSKNGFSNDSPYALTAASSVWSSYQLLKPDEEYYQTPICHGMNHKDAIKNSCDVYSSVLRCNPEKLNDVYINEKRKKSEKIDEFECSISKIAITSSPLDSQLIDLTEKSLEALLLGIEKRVLVNHKEIKKLRKEKKSIQGYISTTSNSDILSKRNFRNDIDQNKKTLLLLELHRINSLLRQIAIIKELGTSAPSSF